MPIPRLTERLESMVYRRRLELDTVEIKPELNILLFSQRSYAFVEFRSQRDAEDAYYDM